MTEKKFITVDGNMAASNIAYAFAEVAAIYPITPSSPMGELADAWSAQGKHNMFGHPLHVQEMQSEGGASGAIHGSLSAGAITTTYTASQGLLLMLPNMYKIAGELLPTVFHVSARSLAYQSLSIFGDHSDVMAARQTGFAFLASSSIQEAQDIAAISHLATMESLIPFLHFFDGFRTSHSIQKIEAIDCVTLKSMVDHQFIKNFRSRALNPDAPFVKVGAQNPDVYFQGREVANKLYDAVPEIVIKYMNMFKEKTGREYKPYMYHGSQDAEKIIIAMGSGIETIRETVEYLESKGEKVGVLDIKLYRPFSVKHFLDAIPSSVKKIAVLDRTKESGSVGEPLYLDVVTSLYQSENETHKQIKVVGGRYGLSSKEFTPTMINAIYEFLDSKEVHHNFTVGIIDDVSHTSIPITKEIDTTEGKKGIMRCKFWGYGSDGTVSANKNSIKIIGGKTDKFVQAYFSYDSKKSGGITVSHLRVSDDLIRSEYLLDKSEFVALHKESYIGRYDILAGIKENGVFLINSIHPKDEVFENLTESMQKTIIDKNIKFYTIDASKIAEESGLKGRISTVMQTAFFKLSNIIDEKDAISYVKEFVEKQFLRKGKEIVDMNWKCIDAALAAIEKVIVPESTEGLSSAPIHDMVSGCTNKFTKDIIEPVTILEGDNIPVSKMTLDGTIPLSTTKIEKRGVAETVPKWLDDKCIQCGQCALVCPHAAIRMKQIDPEELKNAPKTFRVLKSTTKNDRALLMKIQVYPEDCMECNLCVNICPTKALEMVPIQEERDAGENENVDFFESLPDNVLDGTLPQTVKGTQFKTPLFEFSGACAGCGETPYVKLVTQLFGEEMIVANATGCSSIYGGTFPTTPYAKAKNGKGPAWANSLFEDNAEYGYGMKMAVETNRVSLKAEIEKLLKIGTTDELKKLLVDILEVWVPHDDESKAKATELANKIKELLPIAKKEVYGDAEPVLERVIELQNYLTEKSVWIFGGDGWAYDIGYGGLDHVLAQGKNVNVLVMDTEVYSNTGGQASKATPIGASAKFAYSGKPVAKKNLGLMMMTYGNVYVASIAMGANQIQTIKAIREAEAYDGPSLIICYSPCIAHGINMSKTQEEMKRAVQSGYWPLYRFNPDNVKNGKPALTWETPNQKLSYKDFIMGENRYKTIFNQDNDAANILFDRAEEDARRRFADIKILAEMKYDDKSKDDVSTQSNNNKDNNKDNNTGEKK